MKHIPNILTVLRLLLVVLFVYMFFGISPLASLPVFLLAGATDVLDGYLARHNGWTSTFGRVLDPVADKLMQCAVLISFVIAGYLPLLLALLFIVKELTQGICSIVMFRYRHVVTASRWYGKTAICAFYLAVSLTILFRMKEPPMGCMKWILAAVWILTLVLMLTALVSYIVCYARMAIRMRQDMSK